MKKLLFYTQLYYEFPDRIIEFKREFPDLRVEGVEDEEGLKREIPDSEAVVLVRPEPGILELAKKLQVIFIPFTGVNRLPFEYLLKKDIIVSNNHGNGRIVAERAVALALSLIGRIVEFHNDMRMGEWHRPDDSKKPFDYWTSLQEKRVTILGCGVIGRNIARLIRGFDCHITGFKKNIAERPEGFDKITDDLEQALSCSDLVFFALTLTSSTNGMINRETVHLLKDKYIVNVARGSLIEEKVLYESLLNHYIRGAAIDSWYNYPNSEAPYTFPSRYPFQKLNNVVMSPHAASHSVEGKIYQLEHTLRNIRAFLESGMPLDVVDLKEEY